MGESQENDAKPTTKCWVERCWEIQPKEEQRCLKAENLHQHVRRTWKVRFEKVQHLNKREIIFSFKCFSDDGEQSNDDQNSVKIVKPKPDSTQGKSKPGPSQVKPKLGSSQVKSKPGSSQVKSKVGSSQDKAKPVAAQEKLKPESAQSKLKLEASPDKPKLEASQDEQKPVAPQVKPATNGKNKQKKKANTGNQPKVTSAPVVSNKNAKTLGPVVTAFKTRGHVKGSNPQVANGKSSNQQQAGANKRKFNEFGSKTTPNNSKKMKFNKSITKPAPSNELSENRLKAFGINPKKFKNKIKYANNNQQQGAQQHQKKKFQKNSKNVA